MGTSEVVDACRRQMLAIAIHLKVEGNLTEQDLERIARVAGGCTIHHRNFAAGTVAFTQQRKPRLSH